MLRDLADLNRQERQAALGIGSVLEEAWRSVLGLSQQEQAEALAIDGFLLEVTSQGSENRQKRIGSLLISFTDAQVRQVLNADGVLEALRMLPAQHYQSLVKRVKAMNAGAFLSPAVRESRGDNAPAFLSV